MCHTRPIQNVRCLSQKCFLEKLISAGHEGNFVTIAEDLFRDELSLLENYGGTHLNHFWNIGAHSMLCYGDELILHSIWVRESHAQFMQSFKCDTLQIPLRGFVESLNLICFYCLGCEFLRQFLQNDVSQSTHKSILLSKIEIPFDDSHAIGPFQGLEDYQLRSYSLVRRNFHEGVKSGFDGREQHFCYFVQVSSHLLLAILKLLDHTSQAAESSEDILFCFPLYEALDLWEAVWPCVWEFSVRYMEEYLFELRQDFK